MFTKANKAYEASGASAAALPKKQPAPPADVKRTPLLPTSPCDGSIVGLFRRSLASTSPTATPTRPSTKLLQPCSVNKPHTVTGLDTSRNNSSNRVSGLATLCGKPNSFAEEPCQVAVVPSATIGQDPAAENTLMAFGFSLDDIIDDADLDLDYQPCDAVVTPQIATPELLMTVGNNRPRSIKRTLPDDSALNCLRSSTKKRTLPKDWIRAARSELPITTTPTGKQTTAIWETTASTVKAQKKQLKDQLRKQTAPSGGEDVLRPGVEDPHQEPVDRISLLSKPSAPLILSNEQQHVKNLVCVKKASVFFTGPAGTGKSVLMRAVIDDLRAKYAKEPEQLGITASTGLAACNIGGMTLHSFAGIGLGKEDVQTLVRKIRQNQKAKNRWLKTKTLVIDEVSMVDGELFDKLSQIGRTVRKNGRPWGGIQLVLTGDFFQLPPVPDREKRDVKFAFEGSTWTSSIDHTIGLTEVFRQKDPEFAQMLNEMRLGRISDQTVQTFKSLARPIQFNDGLEVTELFPTRQEVESSNERRLKELHGKAHVYEALDSGDPHLREKLLQNMMAPKRLELRVGAQVMLIKNMDETLVNGSLGTVEKFMTESEYATFDADFQTVDPETKKRTKILNSYLSNESTTGGGGSGGGGRLYPYVLFHGIGGTSRGILMRPEEWKSELPNGYVQASRTQIPLILAWALSIHKAQGQTLERVKVDLGRVFEKGQAYVALSRATSKHGLQVLRFEKHKVMAHPKVVDFYSKLSSAESALKGKGDNSSILAFTKRSSVKIEQQRTALVQKCAKEAFGKS